MKKFVLSWIINTLAVLIAVYLVTGINYQKPLDLIVASLLLGILNSVIRPVLTFLTFPLVIVSLGLFLLVINALLLYFVGFLLKPHFTVNTFMAAFWGALIISCVSIVLNSMTGNGAKVKVQRAQAPPPTGGGNGPVIDV
ncbi:MAG TPA: phage holin family protein [Verrucomicrobiae bacterium]|nr:phage holin family protein [Verrucomicrobiae bacterium]